MTSIPTEVLTNFPAITSDVKKSRARCPGIRAFCRPAVILPPWPRQRLQSGSISETGTGGAADCPHFQGPEQRVHQLVREEEAASRDIMPKGGRKGGHKGRVRQYTSPEEIDAQIKAEHEKAQEAELEESGVGATGDPTKEKKDQSSDESDDDDDYQQKRKGVEGLIDIENPNRAAQASKKVAQIDLEGPKELSRREREEIEKQKAKERYMKMHLAGKTDQAKADLARLAIIRKQREEAAKKKVEEKKTKDPSGGPVKSMQSMSLNKP